MRPDKESIPPVQLISWNTSLESAITFSNSSIMDMTHEQLKEGAFTFVKTRDVVGQTNVIDPFEYNFPSFSTLLVPRTESAVFHLKFSIIEEDTSQQALKDEKPSMYMEEYQNGNFKYQISIECILAGETQALSSIIALDVPQGIHQSRGGLQYVCSSDETSISLGFIELDIRYDYEDMSVSVRDVNQSVF